MHVAERSYSDSAAEYRKLNSIAGGGHAETPSLPKPSCPNPLGLSYVSSPAAAQASAPAAVQLPGWGAKSRQ